MVLGGKPRLWSGPQPNKTLPASSSDCFQPGMETVGGGILSRHEVAQNQEILGKKVARDVPAGRLIGGVSFGTP